MKIHRVLLSIKGSLYLNVDWDADSSEKGEFEDFMLKEVHEQPKAIRETIGSKINENSKCEFEELNFTKKYLEGLNKIYFVACGTSSKR